MPAEASPERVAGGRPPPARAPNRRGEPRPRGGTLERERDPGTRADRAIRRFLDDVANSLLGFPLNTRLSRLDRRMEGEAVTADVGVLDQLKELDKQNGATIGRLLANGKAGTATEGSDGKMHASIRIPEDELVYEPSVLMVPHGGTIELEFTNDDTNTHCAVVPSNGDTQFLWLLNHSRGTMTVTLDGPGYYWYGSIAGNEVGNGLTGAIVVGGDAPPEAKLDRPQQPRP